MLYGRLDGLRERASAQLAQTLLQSGGTLQERSQRDSLIGRYTDQVATFGAVENGLCFGRLDFLDGHHHYIGRIGIFDEEGEYEPLLLDWRAPSARPFYLATAASPLDVRRRRQIRTSGRKVTELDDEVLDLETAAAAPHHDGLTSEAALFAALGAGRTGRMRDIVQTIQAEQDRIIRADLSGVLVVQGGPGTGKTAVALHRAAYLLYTFRQELSTRAVLVLGPNETFLKYISQVLPSLAETGVLLRTVGDLFPGVSAHATESDTAAEVKGRAVMADVLAQAVRDRQRAPEDYLEIVLENGDHLVLDRATCEDARANARRTGKPHNLARSLFDTEVIHALSLKYADAIGVDPYADDPLGGDDAPGEAQLLEEADLAEIRRELAMEPGVQTALDWLWPVLTPQTLLSDLYRGADRLAAAAPMLSESERALLARPRGSGWTPADAPLLDEAAELLGEDDRDAELLARWRRRQQSAYAEGALEILHGSRSIDLEDEIDPEILTAVDLLDAGILGERHEEKALLTAAERAAADRNWAFGHIIVDEAQELSPMAWRLLMRRSPSRSMTVVGDVAQTGDLSGISAWGQALEPYVGQRWRHEELTVNYRTPAEIMTLAGKVLTEIDPALLAPRSVRSTGTEPEMIAVADGDLAASAARTALAEADPATLADGRLGVLVPAGMLDEVGAAVLRALPQAALGAQADLENQVVVLTVRQAKGLEFDSVVVVDPTRIVTESPRGHSDLYVALTRATQRLTVLHPAGSPLPL
ncbi:HelD family protein [Catellatospora tritici]|uniref:HelD family protein n=1 Tax=Catellatospora tritici TaxID=2851566 RepID=UPI001C2D3D9C|nr:AAA family ATPase [Catellatospora tritici]MBV1856572.1 AAA family ATPase [Catellatospora tritici]